jgi:transcriptional regulator with XRE-family HTH domain
MDLHFSIVYKRRTGGDGMKEIRRLFGDNVRALRTARGLSQEELGEMAGVHYTYISQVERGVKNCTLEVVERIAAGLQVAASELLAFPQLHKDITKQKVSVLSEIKSSSPEVVKLFADLLADLKTLGLKPKGRTKKSRNEPRSIS